MMPFAVCESQIRSGVLATRASGGKTYLNVLNDGNTVGWYMSSDSIVKDGSDLVRRWGDYLNTARDLLQATGTNQPTWTANGVLFDGVDNYMTAGFTWGGTATVYIALVVVTYEWPKVIYSQYGANPGLDIVMRENGVDELKVNHTGDYTSATNIYASQLSIIKLVINGASSAFSVNDLSDVTFDFSFSLFGLTIGAKSDASLFSNILVKEIICRDVVDSAGDITLIKNYLNAKY
jgi:hypothetical protein